MILISYFCGGGGNRYQFYLENNFNHDKPGYYHTKLHELSLFEITDDSPIVGKKDSILHTHCLNSQLLKKVFPSYNIIKIKTNMELTTYRGWSLLENNKPMNNIKRTDSAFSWICHVYGYYKKYPVDWEADKLIDVEKQDCEFSEIFLKELTSYEMCAEWKLAKHSYDQFGENAPIIDLAEAKFNE